MAVEEVVYAWKNGEILPWHEAMARAFSRSLHVGLDSLEGIRCYHNEKTGRSFAFRLRDHVENLHCSCKNASIEIPYSVDELCEAILETISANKLTACYVRPLVHHDCDIMGINSSGLVTDFIILCCPWETSLGVASFEDAAVDVSTWHKSPDVITPFDVESATTSYVSPVLAKLDSLKHGYAGVITLDEIGLVFESPEESLFVVHDGLLFTSPLPDGTPENLTRDTILQLARKMKVPVVEKRLSRTDLYIADEIFMTGSTVELTPIRSIDGCIITDRGPGKVTRSIQKQLSDIVFGKKKSYMHWLTEI